MSTPLEAEKPSSVEKVRNNPGTIVGRVMLSLPGKNVPADEPPIEKAPSLFYWDTAAGLHFQRRLHVLHGLLENLDRIVIRALLHQVKGVVDGPLRDALLALNHDAVDQPLHQGIGKMRIPDDFPPAYNALSRHIWFSNLTQISGHTPHPSVHWRTGFPCLYDALGRLAPYFDRP